MENWVMVRGGQKVLFLDFSIVNIKQIQKIAELKLTNRIYDKFVAEIVANDIGKLS